MRAAELGVHPDCIEPARTDGNVVRIGPRTVSLKDGEQRRMLERRILREGFGPVMDEMAYTWFNRFAAIRYMELHGYLQGGMRLLSDIDQPEMLRRAHEVALPGLDAAYVLSLKMDGNRDDELFRMLFLAQCRALHTSMPLLFDSIGSETELLLPSRLLRPDSIMRELVRAIEEEDWQHIEIVGWLYQFYISERKEEVIGKVVPVEDLPAATQLFTPRWIVRYLVQNALGVEGEYSVVPASFSFDPARFTFLDPAVGSGHFLVEAYDALMGVYLQRGYRKEEAVRRILEDNLFGLDIDPRAVQLASFALMMKGRRDDRELLTRPVRLKLACITRSAELDTQQLAAAIPLAEYGLERSDLEALKELFAEASGRGSLIRVPKRVQECLPRLRQMGDQWKDMHGGQELLVRLADQASMLSRRYDAVATNPPYMVSNLMHGSVKAFARKEYPAAKRDLFACFIVRALELAKDDGCAALVTMHSWMFLSSYQRFRVKLLQETSLKTMAHLGARAFGAISGEVVQTTAFVLEKKYKAGHKPVVHRLVEGKEQDKEQALREGRNRFDHIPQDDFRLIPGSPVVYWVSEGMRWLFRDGTPLGELVEAKVGLQTGNNDLFLRRWWEVDVGRIGFGMKNRKEARESGRKWFPCNKGGSFRKWYGNHEYVVNWENDGEAIRAFGTEDGGRRRSNVSNTQYYFRPALTWSDITSGPLSFRLGEGGDIFNNKGHCAFHEDPSQLVLLTAYCNTPVCHGLAQLINSTVSFQVGDFQKVPLHPLAASHLESRGSHIANELVSATRADWDAYERSWEFRSLPFLPSPLGAGTVEASHSSWRNTCRQQVLRCLQLEQENNRLVIQACKLEDELFPDIAPPRTHHTHMALPSRATPPTGMAGKFLQKNTNRACYAMIWQRWYPTQ